MTHTGFTMMELLTVIAIVGLLTFMVLGNYGAFGGQIILRTLAYDMALSVREAQTFGVSVRRSDASTFASGYGIHFSSREKNTYRLFVDSHLQSGASAGAAGGDGVFTDPREEVKVFRIGNGHSIRRLCVTTTQETCYMVGPSGPERTIDILFKRPEPDAQIRLDRGAPLRSARIELQSPRGNIRSVSVEVTGQISVQ